MKPAAVVVSDCQGAAIAWVLGQLHSLQRHYDFSQFNSWEKPQPLAAVPPDILDRCTLLFYQVTAATPISAIAGLIPDQCQVVRFGSPSFGALYPRRSRWPRNSKGTPLCALPDELADRVAIKLIKSGLDRDSYLDAYFDRPIEVDGDIDETFAADCSRLQEYDRHIHIQVAEYICSNIRKKRLFHAFDHPTNDLYLFQMRAMIDHCSRLGLPGFEDPRELKAGLLRVEETGPQAFGGTEFFGAVQTPIHPEVAAALGLRHCDQNTVYDNKGFGRWTHREYIAALYNHLRPFSRNPYDTAALNLQHAHPAARAIA